MKKPAPKFHKRVAAIENADAATWQCETCPKMIEPEMTGPHCRDCASYWHDVEHGLFDDGDDWLFDETAQGSTKQ